MSINDDLTSLDAGGKIVKMEVDYSTTCDEKIPLWKSWVSKGKVQEAIDQLLALEKQTRTGADMASTARILVAIVQICFEAKNWTALNDQIVLLSKRRSQLKQAVVKMVQECYTYVDKTPDKETKIKLIETLRSITEGKIYVEVERARLTHILAKIREEEGNVAEAAKIIQELQVETYGSMDKREKVELILEQMRLCLAIKDYVRTQIIWKKINTKFFEEENTQLTVGGDGSCGICSACVGRLRDASDFKLQVQRSQAELRARLQGALRVKDEDMSVDANIADGDGSSEQSVLGEEPPVKPEMMDEDGTDEELGSEMADGDGTSDEDDPISLLLDGCAGRPVYALASSQLAMTCSVRLERLRGDEAPTASHTSLATLHESRRASRMKETHDNTGTAGLRAEEAYTCDTCGKHFTGKSSLIAHVRRHLAQDDSAATYSCGTCSEQFSCKNLFARHTHAHTGQETYVCDMCNKQFRAKTILIRHIKTHVELKRYSCVRVCSKSFKKRSKLKRHELIHTGVKPYSCEQCHKRFTQKSYLNAHERTHTGVKPYSCGECKKQFSQKSNLEKHNRIHTGVKPYGCEQCHKRFTQKGSLDSHRRIHTGVKPYSCKECHKQFIRKGQLDEHKRTHTGVKPYICGECHKQFNRKGHLDDHKIIHTGVKPYSCKECHKQFTRKGNLDRHKRTHTGENPYRCDVCNKPFRSKREVVKHTRRVHSEEYMCEICESLFSSKSSLIKHIRIHMNRN